MGSQTIPTSLTASFTIRSPSIRSGAASVLVSGLADPYTRVRMSSEAALSQLHSPGLLPDADADTRERVQRLLSAL